MVMFGLVELVVALLVTAVVVRIALVRRPRSKPAHRLGFADTACLKVGFSAKKVPANLDAIVIGSGLGGLSAASIMAQRGKRVLVLEQHDHAGGCTHVFEERSKATGKVYEFDTGLHYVGGMNKGHPLRRLIDLVCDRGVEWEPMAEAHDVAINMTSGVKIPIHKSKRKFKETLLQHFPNEGKAIDDYLRLVKAVERSTGAHFVAKILPRPLASLVRAVFGRSYLKFSATTTQEALEEITDNQDLIGVLTYLWGDVGLPPRESSLIHHCMIANHYFGGAYYPLGGSAQLAATIVPVIERAGGAVLVRAPVSAILLDPSGKRAVGVSVKGVEVKAPMVVSACGLVQTITRLVPEPQRALFPELGLLDTGKLQLSCTMLSVFVGLDGSQKDLKLPNQNLWCFPTWDHDKNKSVEASGEGYSACFISFPSSKESSWEERHPGTSVALVILPVEYGEFEKWEGERVKHRGDDYDALKLKYQERALHVLFDQVPQAKGKVDFVEVGSPLSNNFYLGTKQGEVYGLAGTPSRWHSDKLRMETPIKGLFIGGQDMASPGIAGALIAGLLVNFADPLFAVDIVGLLL